MDSRREKRSNCQERPSLSATWMRPSALVIAGRPLGLWMRTSCRASNWTCLVDWWSSQGREEGWGRRGDLCLGVAPEQLGAWGRAVEALRVRHHDAARGEADFLNRDHERARPDVHGDVGRGGRRGCEAQERVARRRVALVVLPRHRGLASDAGNGLDADGRAGGRLAVRARLDHADGMLHRGGGKGGFCLWSVGKSCGWAAGPSTRRPA